MRIPGFMRASKSVGINEPEIASPLKAWGISWSGMKLLPRSEKFKPPIK
jgi:hypothetical protein